jgi:hypothetical protein
MIEHIEHISQIKPSLEIQSQRPGAKFQERLPCFAGIFRFTFEIYLLHLPLARSVIPGELRERIPDVSGRP